MVNYRSTISDGVSNVGQQSNDGDDKGDEEDDPLDAFMADLEVRLKYPPLYVHGHFISVRIFY